MAKSGSSQVLTDSIRSRKELEPGEILARARLQAAPFTLSLKPRERRVQFAGHEWHVWQTVGALWSLWQLMQTPIEVTLVT
jgi:hypothetical protein